MWFKKKPQPQAALFTAPTTPKKTQPIVLTEGVVKALFAKAPPIILNDGPVAVPGKVIGWMPTKAGPLGAIIVNPVTDLRYLFGIDFQTGRPRQLGQPWTR